MMAVARVIYTLGMVAGPTYAAMACYEWHGMAGALCCILFWVGYAGLVARGWHLAGVAEKQCERWSEWYDLLDAAYWFERDDDATEAARVYEDVNWQVREYRQKQRSKN